MQSESKKKKYVQIKNESQILNQSYMFDNLRITRRRIEKVV